jgi:hypothetical protein
MLALLVYGFEVALWYSLLAQAFSTRPVFNAGVTLQRAPLKAHILIFYFAVAPLLILVVIAFRFLFVVLARFSCVSKLFGGPGVWCFGW